jgi:hypothetical protein
MDFHPVRMIILPQMSMRVSLNCISKYADYDIKITGSFSHGSFELKIEWTTSDGRPNGPR